METSRVMGARSATDSPSCHPFDYFEQAPPSVSVRSSVSTVPTAIPTEPTIETPLFFCCLPITKRVAPSPFEPPPKKKGALLEFAVLL